ncbi:hypothetical protein IC582_022552 [Cucumis melo]|uniref:Tic22-like family protein isoform 2 n=1 Tax=Cucumis melo var. makuwa TaxID=1194695 RepID=A0A5D3C3X0_CUCMM|nr:Tic22-like family protein isoform 2 [Cucumis melo var. makuwa]TYK05994.1 Tic22-like family protein isoform 2 [Cucumis melo var. makuwa]
MAFQIEPSSEPHEQNPLNFITHFFLSSTSNFSTLFANPQSIPPFSLQSSSSKLCIPVAFPPSPKPPFLSHSGFHSIHYDLDSSKSAAVKGLSSSSDFDSGFPTTLRISGLNSDGKAGGPAFVGQVFSMCDLSGAGLMAVTPNNNIPFVSKRTQEWLKKMFSTITKSKRNGPIFRFFTDLGDAVTYVKRLNIPSAVVGVCRLDLAYEHFKEKPDLFQFIPNEKQVQAANKLLKGLPQNGGSKKIDGVPVFSAQNLDIAIATTDGVKWYTPYFFDKNMLDKVLEESVDQHFHGLIQTRRLQRRREIVDDNAAAEVLEEMGDSLLEPPEVQEVMDEMGNPGIPLSVISKVAEMQLLYTVDKVILGNRWLRKAVGIQPKFPYMVDSFERRSAASLLRIQESASGLTNSESVKETKELQCNSSSPLNTQDNREANQEPKQHSFNPFRNWFGHLWSKQRQRDDFSKERTKHNVQPSPFLPKITMVGISTGESAHTSKANLKKKMEDLTRELEHIDQANAASHNEYEFNNEERDPLFVANVSHFSSGLSKAGSARWVRGND